MSDAMNMNDEAASEDGREHAAEDEQRERAIPPEADLEETVEIEPLEYEEVVASKPVAPYRGKPRARKKMSRSRRIFIFIALPVILLSLAGGSVTVLNYMGQYHNDLSLASQGIQNLQKAESLLKVSPQSLLDARNVDQARQAFSQADQNFATLNGNLAALPGFVSRVPVYGSRLQAAQHMIPIAINISQLGITGCDALKLLETKFHDPLATQAQGLTTEDLTQVGNDVQKIQAGLAVIADQVNHLQPVDLQADPRITKEIGTLRKALPEVQSWLTTVDKLLPIAPLLLGIGKPTNYLLEILDSTELRPGGGFIGNYGVLTLSGGQVASAHITDVDLLDKPYEFAGNYFPYPRAYSWFDIGSVSWSLRDSNLDADFPTDARNGEMTYKEEKGNVAVQGVIAITPWFIQHILEITGPIDVPEYKETVNAANLIPLIHYHQLGGKAAGEGSDLIPAAGGHSSLRKRFTELLSEHLLERIRQMASTDLSQFLQLGIDALYSKDIQVYFNNSTAETFLQSLQLDDAIQSPPGDNMLVVDANISANKANSFITNSMNDQVTIDAQGNAVHHLTLHYAWDLSGKNYGNPTYRDYVRVYAPVNSTLQEQKGWQVRGTSTAFGHEVWAGFFTLTFGQTHTITLVWSVPHAATRDAQGWHYQEMVQRQAGAMWTALVQITLPGCATIKSEAAGLTSPDDKTVVYSHTLNGNQKIGVDYSCA